MKTPVFIECKDEIMDLSTLPTDRTIVMGTTGEWEAYCLKYAARILASFPRFLYLKDSCRILDPDAFWRDVDGAPKDQNTFLFSDKNCYLGIFSTEEVAAKMAPMRPHSKWDSIKLEWRMASLFPGGFLYETGEPYPNHSDLEGRKRMEFFRGNLEVVYGNEIIEKWKSTSGCGCKTNKDAMCKHMLAGLREDEAHALR